MAGIEFRDTFKKYLKLIEEIDGNLTKTIRDLANELDKDGMPKQDICTNICKELKGLVSEQYIRRILPPKYKHEEKARENIGNDKIEKQTITVGTNGKQFTGKEETEKAREEALKRIDPRNNPIPDESKRVIEKLNKELQDVNTQIQKRDKQITEAKTQIQKQDNILTKKAPAIVTMIEKGLIPEYDIKAFRGSITRIKTLIQESYKNTDDEYICFIQRVHKVGNGK